jgi:Stress responsive A/B Barrel Domain
MKKTFAFLFILIAMTTIATAQNHPGKMLRHVVLFKFKDGTTVADIKKVEDAFRALPSKIKEIKNLEWGTNNSPENLNQGFTHCFFVTFSSEKDRAVYLPHPAHKAFGETLHPYLDKVLVLDFWAQK